MSVVRPLLWAALLLSAWGGPVFGDTDRGDDKTLTIMLDKDKKIVMKFVRIKPGEFLMGSPESEAAREPDEKQHEVKITKTYWMQTTPVTQGQWEAVMGNNPSYFKGDPNFPVEQVSYTDCEEFFKKLNEKCRQQLGRWAADFPTEAQWEYACRAGSKDPSHASHSAGPGAVRENATGRWCFGDDESKLEEYAWYLKNSGAKTHPVGEKPSAWGLYDMHGNVWQWCKDWYQESLTDAVDPQGPENDQHRVLRGGGWVHDAGYARSAYRSRYVPVDRLNYLGVRVALRKSP